MPAFQRFGLQASTAAVTDGLAVLIVGVVAATVRGQPILDMSPRVGESRILAASALPSIGVIRAPALPPG